MGPLFLRAVVNVLEFTAMKTTLETLYKPIEDELRLTQSFVAELWAQALALVLGPSVSPPKAGGKLLRPAMCLLAAGAVGARDIRSFTKMATACELLHMAALTHDDVVDKADLRRGTTSLNALWDDRTAVLGGDYLVSRSVEFLTTFDSCPLIADIFGAVRRMTEGELGSLGRNTERFTQKDCIRLAEEKTGTFFATACTAPTYLVGKEYREPLHAFGMAFGVAFQLIDDILDITQPQDALGKPSCGDIVEGKKTLPILFMREQLGPEDRERLNGMIGRTIGDQGMIGRTIGDQDRAWAAQAVERSGARARALGLARGYIDTARAALDPLPSSVYKDSILGLAEFVLVRDS